MVKVHNSKKRSIETCGTLHRCVEMFTLVSKDELSYNVNILAIFKCSKMTGLDEALLSALSFSSMFHFQHGLLIQELLLPVGGCLLFY